MRLAAAIDIIESAKAEADNQFSHTAWINVVEPDTLHDIRVIVNRQVRQLGKDQYWLTLLSELEEYDSKKRDQV